MIVLALDASTYTGTVALIRDGLVVDERETAMRGKDQERLMPAVVDVLAAHRLMPGDVGTIAGGAGPGSFTSLRIAASIAKGMASAHTTPLCAAPSPLLIVAGASVAPSRYLAVLDAMRGDVFALAADVDRDGAIVPRGTTVLLSRPAALERANDEDRTL